MHAELHPATSSTDATSVRRVLRRSVFVIGFLLLSGIGQADSPRRHDHFVSDNGRFVLVQIHRSLERRPVFEGGRFVGVMDRRRVEDLWGLFDARSAEPLLPPGSVEELGVAPTPLYTLRGDFAAKTALIDNGGRVVVIVDDFSEATPEAALEVLEFHADGERVGAYTLGELLRHIDNVQPTASHFHWFVDRSLRFQRQELSLTTTECVTLTFDPLTAAPPRRTLPRGVAESDRLVYGELHDGEDGRARLRVLRPVHGTAEVGRDIAVRVERRGLERRVGLFHLRGRALLAALDPPECAP